MVLYFSYVSSIDPTLSDSAAIDGASVWQMIRYITLPQLKSVMPLLICYPFFRNAFLRGLTVGAVKE